MVNPSSSTTNLNWHHIAVFGMTATPIPTFKVRELEGVGLSYQRNIRRIKYMAIMPSIIAAFAREFQRCYDVSEYSETEKLEGLVNLESKPSHATTLQNAVYLYAEVEKQRAIDRSKPDWENIFLQHMQSGTATVSALANPGNPTLTGLEAVVSSSILGCWTAFETMAADLWEAALNTHPHGLAELKGKRKRMFVGSGDADDDDTATAPGESRSVSLALIHRHDFEIRNRMGSILRATQRFDHLAGMREAYGLAFHKNFAAIQVALQNEALDGLNAVRNLIVHRNGVVDSTYEKRAKHLKIPKAAVGESIALDAKALVYDLLAPLLVCSLDLLTAADDWVASN
jgi:hypothetical protein